MSLFVRGLPGLLFFSRADIYYWYFISIMLFSSWYYSYSLAFSSSTSSASFTVEGERIELAS